MVEFLFPDQDSEQQGMETPMPATTEESSDNYEICRERRSSDVAIIGISGRFAGSANLSTFWSHLQAGESCIEEIQRESWKTSTLADPDLKCVNPTQAKWGGMLQNIDQFDPLFFNISPLEAARMDPQQRLFLEEVYKSVEDAGYATEQLAEKKVGVFVGARAGDYQEQILQRDGTRRLSETDAHLFLGNDMAMLAARISYFLNLKGASLTIDTASSSSLVAIHLACESLRSGESEMALAGGVFVMSSPQYYLMAAKTHMLSPDGTCRTFDKSANGIVLGEGVGALVLKPLDAAIEDGDHIYGIIKGSATNQDGRTKGITAPNMLSQKALLVSLYQKATIDPATVSYIEAHGTGSKLGDPIEVQALTAAFRAFTGKTQFCAIGSHKTNFGHTIMTAGIAGVFKVLLAMKYQQIPPTINVEEANPQIDWQNSPFFINTELREWKSRDGSPRRAGVSSFGLSGTNCHLILEEPPPQKKRADEQTKPAYFFPISAKTKAALSQKVGNLIRWLEKEGGTYSVEDISYTLVQGRSHFAVRSAVVARDIHELKQCLSTIMSQDRSEHEVEKEKGYASQMEPLLRPYGSWLLQELIKGASINQNEFKDRLSILADLYVKGCNLEWDQLFEKGRGHRVPLPTYPFIGESYWIAECGSHLSTREQSESLLKSYAGDLSGLTNPEYESERRQEGRDKLQPLREALTHTVSRLLKVRVGDIDVETELSEYGFDSITFTAFANDLNQAYQLDLTPALFFENSTLERLARYLHETYASVLAPYFSIVSLATDEVPPESSLSQQHSHMRRSAGSLIPEYAEPIAIIGMSGAFPQAPDVQSLWRNLLESRDCIGEIPASRWDWQTYFGNPTTSNPNKTNIKWAGVIESVELFDPLFFGISPREAEQMDPQQRLLMMYVWKAIEDAGYAASSLSGTNTALFVGTASSGYNERLFRANMAIEGHSSTGLTPSVGPNRMSYFLNLHGPSEAIETACSSSLVAIHRGVTAIESGACNMAIVGGVNTLISPELHISYSKAGMLCEDGRCKTFSSRANGYVRGEGVGMLVLKKLTEAEQDGDHIYGVIRGSAENHGGRAASLTAPNPRAQADLLITAYRKAGIDPRTVGYIEAHGTGTALGDPIEINGLKIAFSKLTETGARHSPYGEGAISQAWCGIGSVKSNIGHLELAAGVAGVIKALLQLQHKTLVKGLHCEQINPYIQLESSPFYIVRENQEWEALRDSAGNTLPRRAGVSSFGFGGANAHVVLEEYLPQPGATLPRGLTKQPPSEQALPRLIVLSAKNEERLHEQVRQLLVWVQAETQLYRDPPVHTPTASDQRLLDLAYTLQVGREAMEERLALQVSSLAELEEKLRRYLQEPQEEAGDWYRGQVKQYKETVALFGDKEEIQEFVERWFQQGKYQKLLQWWVKGGNVDWRLLSPVGVSQKGQGTGSSSCPLPIPRRISLPTYPFARERYWLSAPSVEPISGSRAAVTSPRSSHPIALRPLADGPVPSHGEMNDHQRGDQGQATVPLSRQAGPTGAKHLHLSITEANREEEQRTGAGPRLGVAVHELEEELVRSLARALGMNEGEIDKEAPFVEIGVDSIIGVEWVRALNEQYSISLSTTKLYAYPTVQALARLLAKEGESSGAGWYPQQETPTTDAQRSITSPLPVPEWPEQPDPTRFRTGASPVPTGETSGGSEPETPSAVAMQEIEPGIVQVTMQDRVQKNLFSAELIAGLIQAFEAIEESENAKVVILTGYDSYFASGGTKETLLAIQQGHLQFTDTQIYSLALDCKLPVIAAMQGHAVGAGWSMGMFCDFLIMSRESYYASNYITYGFTPGAGATLIFPEKLGASLAQEVLYTGKHFQGCDLEAKGVAFSVCPRKDVLANALQLARELAQAPREALIGLKELLANSLRERVAATYEREVVMHQRTFVNQPEVKARIEANFGRSAEYTGKKQTGLVSTDQEQGHQEAGRVAASSLQRAHSSPPLAKSTHKPEKQTRQNAIAIIGMSGRYPDARNLSDWWENLAQGKNAIREIPRTRFDISDRYDPDQATGGKISCKWLGALEDIESFDPLFFHISPREAQEMDPQHRLFLEEGYKALEDAGYSPGLLSNKKCGIYLGILGYEYGLLLSQQKTAEMNLITSSPAIAAARLAYLLNLKGPAIPIDTACSSSLVATHLACQALRDQEIDMALVGGVALCLTSDFYVSMCTAGMLSPDGRCKTFDASANGFVPGEGVGALVLKRLADAEADHDQIYGVIIGSGINQDGATNGITAPNLNSQMELEREIYEKYAIDPASISYVEMHGTGTKLGDPIELEALSTVFSEKTRHKQYCAIGSVKTNIGHTLAAAGVAGVQKVLLAMQQKKLVPSLHFDQPNEHFDFDASPFFVNTKLQDWEAATGTALRAAVSSFGFSGTNSHLVIEEYIQQSGRNSSTNTSILFVLSAKSEQQLKSYAQGMKHWIQTHEQLALVDIAFTLQLGREAMDHRLAILADSREILLQRLEGFIDDRSSTGIYRAQVKKGTNDATLFEADADGRSLLHIWCQNRNLERIAQIWVRGINVDWNLLYTVGAGKVRGSVTPNPALPYRVGLPTYPFARRRYWIPIGASPMATVIEPCALSVPTRSLAARTEEETQTVLVTPSWKEEMIREQELPPHPAGEAAVLALPVVFLCELPNIEASRLQTQMASGGRCYSLLSLQSRREHRFQDIVVQLIQELQRLHQSQPTRPMLVQVIIAHTEEPSCLEALAGVLWTAQQECPKLAGQLIEVEGELGEEELLARLRENQFRMPQEPRIRYRDGKRWVREWQEHPLGSAPPKIPWKEGGCYLITGGTGGLARLFVQEIARQVGTATIILVGRSALSVSQRAALESIVPVPNSSGARHTGHSAARVQGSSGDIRIDYQQADVSDGSEVRALIQGIIQKSGHLDGIIHAAGILRDSLLLNKTQEEVQAVLASKVIGVEQLDRESRKIPLDFFILCSSIAAIVGNVGQIDYAAANAYLDAFAHARQALVEVGQRWGVTLSINWPLWKAGGMQIGVEAAQMMRERLGMEAMGTEVGMKALYQAIAMRQAQVIVLHGDLSKIRKRMVGAPLQDYSYLAQAKASSPLVPEEPRSPMAQVTQAMTDQEELRKQTLQQMKVLFAEVTKLSPNELDVDEPLENYGIESLMITRLTQKLFAIFKDFSRTFFDEYPTLSALGEHLLESYPQECLQWTGQLFRYPSHATYSGTLKKEEVCGPNPPRQNLRTDVLSLYPLPNGSQTAIAIIGISGRYPQAKSMEEYWENLKAGKSCITEIPRARWDWRDYYQNNREQAIALGKSYSKWGAFLDDFDQFDPLFFQMAPREAEEIDPQERLFLEECWKALEDAGYSPSSLSPELRQRTGVFGGITKQGFNLYSVETPHQFPSTSFASLVNRVSSLLNLQGKSTVVDTMCSSALVAIHEACEYIQQGKGDMALAGGVNLYVHPSTYIGLSRNQVISHTEKSAAFGKGGHGFVPGEGVGVIVLKALDQAIKDGDSIYAVIRGSAVNHNGRTHGSRTPDPSQQAAVIQQALEQQALDPRTISYIEAAASGSETVDALEMAALVRVFGERDSRQEGYKIGSVKPSLGHAEAASGMAQLTKVILSLKHKMLVPTAVPEDFHPLTPMHQWPFQLQREVSPWRQLTVDGALVPRRAGITSVGAGGVNAHLIVEEYITQAEPAYRSTDPTTPIVFVLSAKDKERLSEYVKRWVVYLKKKENVDLEHIAYTLQIGREEMPCRLAIVAHTQEELVQRLEQWILEQRNANHCYFSAKPYSTGNNATQIEETGDIHSELAKLWVAGNSVSWKDLYKGKHVDRIAGLPTYPFKRRTCWIDRHQDVVEAVGTVPCASPPPLASPALFPSPVFPRRTEALAFAPMVTFPSRQDHENKVVEFYTLEVERSKEGFQTEYLTFCPFEEKVPGFSMSRVFLYPEKYPDEQRLMQEKQTEMRQVLFCREDFQQVHTLLDIGCGHGTDIIQIAAQYPHITAHGLTITPAQAEFGKQRIAELNLSSQAQIFQADSSKDAFPARYDLIIGIEVTFHIQDKAGLFQNIASSLNENGKVLLMDYVGNLRGAIVDPKIGVSIPTQQEWLDLLTEHQLVIDEIIDVSPQIANFLDDPAVKDNVKDLPQVTQDMYISYANQAVSLTNGWISYCLLKLKKDTLRSALERWNDNAQKIAQRMPYPQALAEMVRRGHIPYPQSLRDLQKCNHNETFRDLKAIKDDLAEIFLTVLKLEPPELEAAETFQDLGISSISVVRLTEAINSKYNLRMPTSILFECKNMDALVDYINSEMGSVQGTIPTVTTQNGDQPDAIAIIGLSLRCAQAETQDEFWELVSQGKSGIEDITQKDWLDFFQFHSPTEFPYRYARMRNAEYFDPSFFHISPREAKAMDVSQRILLEECYKALEDANYTPSVLSGKQVATVIGSTAIHSGKTDFSHFSMLGSHMSILASRIAYFLNLKGPALAIDTACSSSLVAIDIACQHLKSHEANLAIAGGITIYAHPGAFLSMRDAGMLSPTGECRPFDQAADGIVVGDGVGIVILKRLQDAERDGDYIYGVIQASGTNQDGQTSGITVPSFQSQSQLQQTIYQRHHINVEDLQYIEAHGTATKLGDPIEIHALTDAFKKFTAKKGFCAIGSLKANIGHTTAAAGVLGVIKVLLSLKHKQIPPSINFSRENEHIDFANSPVYVNTTLKPWPANAKGSRLAGISSFGFSGTNAHAVISEYVAQDQRTGTVARVPRATGLPRPYMQINEATPGVLILSAQTQEGLQVSARAIAAFLQKHNDINLADLLYTLQVGRESWPYRLALVITSKEMLITQLEQFVIGKNTEYLKRCARKINKQESLIGDSEEGKELIQKLVQHKKLEKLADLWLHGNEISWEECYPQGSVKRLAGLPNYPFARDHYEISEIDLVPSHTNSYSKGEFSPTMHAQNTDWYQRTGEDPERPAKQGTQTIKEKDKALKSAFAWDRVTLLPQASVASATHQAVIIGGTPEERSAIAHIYPYTHTFEIPTNASIERLVQRLQEFGAIEQLFWLEPCHPQLALTQESILTAQQEGVLTCFRLIKALLQLGYGSQRLHWTVITRQTRILHANETCHPAHASLLGLFGSLAKEYPRWSIQQVDLLADDFLPLTEMLRLPADPQGHGWLYRHGHWYRQILVPLDSSSVKTSGAYRKGGVYVVIGGAGGIGEVWSEYLIRRYQAQMIWIGRRQIDAAILTKQERLADLGPRPHYITADATDRRALQQAYEEIKRNYGQIHGVVHSAIVLLDQSLANMDEERFQSALAAKVDVSVRLAQVFEQEPLDFVLFFSSLNAFVRNTGQSNYAAGCTFEDAFAARLGQDWPCAVKVMNWGYWGSVGVVAQPVYRERMAQVGMGSIEPEEAMEALEYLLAGPVKQMALLKTTKLPISHDSILVSVPSRGSRKDTDSRYLPAGKAYTPNPSSSSANVLGEEMMQTGEIMMVYPEHTPSFLHRLYNYRPPLLKTENVRETQ